MGTILAFPRIRDQPFVERHARRMAAFRPHKAEQHLARLLAGHADTLLRRGLPPVVISEELQAIEGAIRAALWRRVLLGEGSP